MLGFITVSISWCLSVPNKDDSVTALAVDWVTSNLYWSSIERPDLHVTSHYNSYTTSLLQGSLKVKYALLTFALFWSFMIIFTTNIYMAPSSTTSILTLAKAFLDSQFQNILKKMF